MGDGTGPKHHFGQGNFGAACRDLIVSHHLISAPPSPGEHGSSPYCVCPDGWFESAQLFLNRSSPVGIRQIRPNDVVVHRDTGSDTDWKIRLPLLDGIASLLFRTLRHAETYYMSPSTHRTQPRAIPSREPQKKGIGYGNGAKENEGSALMGI